MSSQISNIIHFKPSLEYKPITFNLEYSENNCQYINKFGEYSCNEKKSYNKETRNCKYCDKHNILLNEFIKKMKHIMSKAEYYKRQKYTIDSFIKLICNISNYFLKHKEYFVNYSLNRPINSLILMLDDNINRLKNCNFNTSLVLCKKSKSNKYHIENLLYFKKQIKLIDINIQIKKSKYELISNNIKINKLSEIYIKSNSNEIIPVICKGIETNILSFIV